MAARPFSCRVAAYPNFTQTSYKFTQLPDIFAHARGNICSQSPESSSNSVQHVTESFLTIWTGKWLSAIPASIFRGLKTFFLSRILSDLVVCTLSTYWLCIPYRECELVLYTNCAAVIRILRVLLSPSHGTVCFSRSLNRIGFIFPCTITPQCSFEIPVRLLCFHKGPHNLQLGEDQKVNVFVLCVFLD